MRKWKQDFCLTDLNNLMTTVAVFKKGFTQFLKNVALTLSDPTSDLVRNCDFPVPLQCRKTSDMTLLHPIHCRSLSDAFSHLVRTLANR